MIIVGAGLTGLIAAHAFPRVIVHEARAVPDAAHKALLRFRSTAVSDLTGIQFRKVNVHKGIVLDGEFVAPSIRTANMYSRKCLGAFLPDRSIWNLASVERYVAPDDFYAQLLDRVADRVVFNSPVAGDVLLSKKEIKISTIPLCAFKTSENPMPGIEFNSAPIAVARYRVAVDCDLHQTLYFPGPETNIYRASITGDTLIVEATENGDGQSPIRLNDVDMVCAAFGIAPRDVRPLDQSAHFQRFGKIAPIDDARRRAELYRLSRDHSIYSLGRFAVWKNILLDDIPHDISVIRSLMSASAYDVARLTNGGAV